MGAAYVFLSCYQFTNVSYRADVPKERYAYFPHSFYMFRVLKIFLFVSFALMLISSGTRIKYLYPICLIIALTEVCVGILKVYRKLCFVSIYANYILFSKISCIKFLQVILKVLGSDMAFYTSFIKMVKRMICDLFI
ncbi:MAG: hypothetical protein IPG08_14290 [Sphingobacteriaceae bacterium]|nr:hypothetical protein [Sphingobacteriaceae bacterium]